MLELFSYHQQQQLLRKLFSACLRHYLSGAERNASTTYIGFLSWKVPKPLGGQTIGWSWGAWQSLPSVGQSLPRIIPSRVPTIPAHCTILACWTIPSHWVIPISWTIPSRQSRPVGQSLSGGQSLPFEQSLPVDNPCKLDNPFLLDNPCPLDNPDIHAQENPFPLDNPYPLDNSKWNKYSELLAAAGLIIVMSVDFYISCRRKATLCSCSQHARGFLRATAMTGAGGFLHFLSRFQNKNEKYDSSLRKRPLPATEGLLPAIV